MSGLYRGTIGGKIRKCEPIPLQWSIYLFVRANLKAQARPATGNKASRLHIMEMCLRAIPDRPLSQSGRTSFAKSMVASSCHAKDGSSILAIPKTTVRIDSLCCARYPQQRRLGRSDAAETSKPRQVRKEAAVQRFLRVPSGCLPRRYLCLIRDQLR